MVFKPFAKVLAGVAMVFTCSVALLLESPAHAQEKKEKKVKDQAEYDIFTAAAKEADANKKVGFLNQWKEKYPESDYKEDRQLMLVTTYQQLRNGEEMWKATNDLLALNPKSFPGLFFMTTLTQSLGNTAADRLDTGEKAARGMLAAVAEVYDPAKKAANVPEAQFAAEKLQMETTARKTIGWIEMTRKNNEKAEQELTALLKINNKSGQVSYWLGQVMLMQKKTEKQIPALYHLARAAHYEGEDALTPDGKKQLQAYLERNYVNFHGSKEGLQELVETALKNPIPDTYPTIKSQAQILEEQDKQFRESDPQKYMWVGLKKGLQDAASGATYWDGTLKGSAMPKFKGKVVSVSPANRPKEVLVSILSDGTAEIKLRMDAAYPNAAEPGTEIEFEGGVAAEFSNDPFLITVDQEKEKLTGWPAPPARPAAKGGAGKKAATKKK